MVGGDVAWAIEFQALCRNQSNAHHLNGVTRMILPDYWLTRPSANLDDSATTAFDELLATAQRIGGGHHLEFNLPWPKWQFLCYVADRYDIALHGSGNANIALFEPRQSND